MVSREQERVNLNLISFLSHVIQKEIGSKKAVKQVDFLSDDSIIGKLFYRILKSQERNVDTVCSMLAHMMNKFISKLQEGNDFDAGANKDAGRSNKKDKNANMQFEFSPKACTMYKDFVQNLVSDIFEGQVLVTNNASFQLKKAWQD